ncbi:MAG TPA: DUF4340 domain-containing protein [Candidatus Bathyarchaeia archaeon]|nr:DUF4340 domain-containing protein [Candidatus Bathyarchaeia archaeon]
MSQKAFKKIFLILVVLVVALILQRSWGKQQLTLSSEKYKQKITGFSKDEIGFIEIISSDEKQKLLLEEKDNQWQLGLRKADNKRVNDLIDSLMAGDQVELIAETDQQHEKMGLKEEQATRLALRKSDKKELKYFLGKSNFSGTYTRFQDDLPVYLISKLTDAGSLLEEDYWHDKTIVSLENQHIHWLKFAHSGSEFMLENREEGWKFKDDVSEVDKDKVEEVIAGLSPLTATSLADKDERNNYQKEKELLLAIGLDDKTIGITFYKGEDDYLAERDPDNELFKISSYTTEGFFKEKADFIKTD